MLMIERDGKLAESPRQDVIESASPSDEPCELLSSPPPRPRGLLERLVGLDYVTFPAAGLRWPL